jgi:hypothetical protein
MHYAVVHMKTTVYSWRVSPETKSALEDEARSRGETMAEVLDRIAREWLESQRLSQTDASRREAQLRAQALRFCGTIAGGVPERATRAREERRGRLRAKRAQGH